MQQMFLFLSLVQFFFFQFQTFHLTFFSFLEKGLFFLEKEPQFRFLKSNYKSFFCVLFVSFFSRRILCFFFFKSVLFSFVFVLLNISFDLHYLGKRGTKDFDFFV